MDFKVEFRPFTPRELTAITGLSATMQRDWRRNGYLPARQTGWSSFNLEDVSRVALLKVFADAGLGPAFGHALISGKSGQRVVASISWWAVEAEEASAWVAHLPSALASKLVRRDAADHFALVDAITGFSTQDRLQTVQIDPIKQVVWLENTAPDDEPFGAISITLRLDAIGRQIARRSVGSVLTFRPATEDG